MAKFITYSQGSVIQRFIKPFLCFGIRAHESLLKNYTLLRKTGLSLSLKIGVIALHFGPEYSGDLNSQLVGYSNSPKQFVC